MKKLRYYCPYCAKTVTHKDVDGKIRDYCPNCKTVFYDNPLPVASSIVVNEQREVLLVRRKNDPYKDMWCLPIGFAEADEEVKDAALRELQEEAGIKGEIVKLIDVDTVDNYFYGSLAIVTYEVRHSGGKLSPGDDAADAGFFPVNDLPPLAWSSNEKALRIYLDLYRDTWAMIDSFNQLFPEDSIRQISPGIHEQRMFLSNILIKLIEKTSVEILDGWKNEVGAGIPAMNSHMDYMIKMNRKVLKMVRKGLKIKKPIDCLEFIDVGRDLQKKGVSLPDILNAMALSRKHIWMHVVRKKILYSPLEIYIALELNNRIIFLYDKINYFITVGYLDR